MKNVAIFVSGSGSNAENIYNYFKNDAETRIPIILCNNKKAYAIERANRLGIDSYVFNREEFYQSENVLKMLHEYDVDFIVLAGFLWLVPDYLIKNYQNRIVNIHPALLPKFGGKGMYGMNVHKAVIENKEKESGITIHYVNNNYDEGNIIFQAKCEVTPEDSPESLAKKISKLEHANFPKVIEEVLHKL